MNHHFQELKKFMSEFLDNIEAAIAKIHTDHGVDNATVTKEIADAVTAAVTPLQEQIAELQKAVQDTVGKLGDAPPVS